MCPSHERAWQARERSRMTCVAPRVPGHLSIQPLYISITCVDPRVHGRHILHTRTHRGHPIHKFKSTKSQREMLCGLEELQRKWSCWSITTESIFTYWSIRRAFNAANQTLIVNIIQFQYIIAKGYTLLSQLCAQNTVSPTMWRHRRARSLNNYDIIIDATYATGRVWWTHLSADGST